MVAINSSSLFCCSLARVENTVGKPSSACFFHWAICVGWTPYSAAISFAVLCPLMASNATFVFSSALYRLRCPAISFLLLGFSRYSYFSLFPCPVFWDHYILIIIEGTTCLIFDHQN